MRISDWSSDVCSSDLPSAMGLTSSVVPKANVGRAEGKGVDVSVDYNQQLGQHTWIQGRANFTYAVSNYLAYEEPLYANEPWKSRIGYNLTQQWGYIAERLFIDDEEVYNSPLQNFGQQTRGGDIKYRDINKDGKITSLDQATIGFPTSPENVYGFGVSFGYKNPDFSQFFQGLGLESFWLDIGRTAPFITASSDGQQLKNQVLQAYANSYWSEANPDPYALWPRLSPSSHPNNTPRNTWFMRDRKSTRLNSSH